MEVTLLNSGGLDSAMVAKWLHGRGVSVQSVYIDTRAENRIQAMLAAEETASRYCDSHRVVSVDFGATSTHTESDGKHSIPLSSLVICTIGAADARLHGIYEVYTGHRAGASSERIEMMNDLIGSSTYFAVKPHINTPLTEAQTYTDAATLLGVSLDDLAYTHSCHSAVPCGTCHICQSRADLWA